MKIKEISKILEEWAPKNYAEDFDNVGLLVGDEQKEISSLLISLDTTQRVVEEAIEKKCGLIISFHPIIFEGLKKITTTSHVEKIITKALKNDIAIYCIHTNLDMIWEGTHSHMASLLDLQNQEVLIPKKQTLKKITTYVPKEKASYLREKLFEAGGGTLQNYTNCSYNLEGVGTFLPNEKANPYVGEKNKLHYEKETSISMIFPPEREAILKKALQKHHPYEIPAYEIITLCNENPLIGLGRIGNLKHELSQNDFLRLIKEKLELTCIRYTPFSLNKKIKRVAFLGGSGSFAIAKAKTKKADVFISSDLKYHQFFEAQDELMLADIGHYESEKHIKKMIHTYLKAKMPKFAIFESKKDENPLNYFF